MAKPGKLIGLGFLIIIVGLGSSIMLPELFIQMTDLGLQDSIYNSLQFIMLGFVIFMTVMIIPLVGGS